MVSLTLAGVMDSVFPPLLEGTSSSLASCSHIEGLLFVEHSWKNDKMIDELVIKRKLSQPDFRKHCCGLLLQAFCLTEVGYFSLQELSVLSQVFCDWINLSNSGMQH